LASKKPLKLRREGSPTRGPSMNCKKNLLVGLGLLLLGQGVLAQTELEYQNRGNRYEGIKPKPVSGYDIELISVLADYKGQIRALPDQIKIQFYLERPSTVFLTVRELDYKLYYWLDRVMPPNPWQAGFGNEFSWGTDVVLRRLDRNMPMY